jgi:hypothetical protein
MKQLRCDSIGWVRVSPSKGSGSLIVGFDVADEFAAQVGHGFEDSTGNHVALDFGESNPGWRMYKLCILNTN